MKASQSPTSLQMLAMRIRPKHHRTWYRKCKPIEQEQWATMMYSKWLPLQLSPTQDAILATNWKMYVSPVPQTIYMWWLGLSSVLVETFGLENWVRMRTTVEASIKQISLQQKIQSNSEVYTTHWSSNFCRSFFFFFGKKVHMYTTTKVQNKQQAAKSYKHQNKLAGEFVLH